jgi:hypothetical protein
LGAGTRRERERESVEKSAENEKRTCEQIIKHFAIKKNKTLSEEKRRKARARQQIFLTTRNFICIIILFFELNACF